MANVKNLKRDINFVTSELIIECLTFDYLLPDNNKAELSALITDALKFRKEMIEKVNNVKAVEVATRGKEYRTIRRTVNNQVTEFVERMEKLNK
jgi:hypothetical protein